MAESITMQQETNSYLDQVVERIVEEDYDQLLVVLTRDMSPYDINIHELASRFKMVLHDMQETDLRIPAKMILACTIILKFKADLLLGDKRISFDDDAELEGVLEDNSEVDLEKLNHSDFFIPSLELPLRRQPKKQVTLLDLRLAFERALIIQLDRDERWKNRKEYTIHMDEHNIQKKISMLFEIVQRKVTLKDFLKFEELLENKDVREKVEKFIHMLHLEGDKKIECIQEEFLGDIFIKLLKQEMNRDSRTKKQSKK